MAQRYVAFLRAINVGGHVVKMDRLRSLMEHWGHGEVETFIASGNVIFTSGSRRAAALEAEIAGRLEAALGYPVATFIRTPAELRRIVAHEAFPTVTSDGGALYVGFLRDRPTAASRKALMALATATDLLHVNDRQVYWRCLTRFSDSPLSGKPMEKALAMPMTMRNITSLTRLLARLD